MYKFITEPLSNIDTRNLLWKDRITITHREYYLQFCIQKNLIWRTIYSL